MTEAKARSLLRKRSGIGGLETWIADQLWQIVPNGWTVDGRVRGRSFLLEPSGNDLRITAIAPTGRAPSEWATWTVTG